MIDRWPGERAVWLQGASNWVPPLESKAYRTAADELVKQSAWSLKTELNVAQPNLHKLDRLHVHLLRKVYGAATAAVLSIGGRNSNSNSNTLIDGDCRGVNWRNVVSIFHDVDDNDCSSDNNISSRIHSSYDYD